MASLAPYPATTTNTSSWLTQEEALNSENRHLVAGLLECLDSLLT